MKRTENFTLLEDMELFKNINVFFQKAKKKPFPIRLEF